MTIESKPASDLVVDSSLVRALIQDQHPDLAHLVPLKVAEGWDNAIFRLGAELAVRIPRRVATATLIEHEQRWLPQLSWRLPIPVPVPLRVGVPSPMFDWALSIVRWLPGKSLLRAVVQDPAAGGAALERFLCALHQPAPSDAPRNPCRGVPLEARTAAVRKHVDQLDGVVDRPAVLSLWDRALSATSWPGPPLWLHGDLHPGNLLVSDGHLSGVIDFGDLTSGDPATDLAVLWMLPQVMRWRVEASRSHEPEALMMRARGWALALGLAYLAHSRGDVAMATLGRSTIDAALDESLAL